jgi:alpha-beta hydrolase superfamily lysophospholipase
MGTTVRFADTELDRQFTRTLTAVYAGACDLGEAFATADRLGDAPGYDDWHRQWTLTADRVRDAASASLARGHRVSARSALLRAAEYYRQAYFFLRRDIADARLLAAHAAARDCFRAALPLLDFPVEPVPIPYQGTSLPGYLAGPGASRVPRGVVVFPCGYDLAAEGGWPYMPDAVARGYAALVFEGPGQGSVLYEQRLPLRHDFEAVLSPVLDWLTTRPWVDPRRIVLAGRSFAGYLAPRAATAESRLAALVCDPGQFEFAGRFAALLGRDLVERALAGDQTADELLEPIRHASPQAEEMTGARMAAHGVASVRSWICEMQSWTLEGRVHKITCPTLIVESEGDFAGGQSRRLADALICPKRVEFLSSTDGVGGHCGGLGQATWAKVVYDWLDETVGPAA